jgi:hypothetical protein
MSAVPARLRYAIDFTLAVKTPAGCAQQSGATPESKDLQTGHRSQAKGVVALRFFERVNPSEVEESLAMPHLKSEMSRLFST